MMRLCLREHNDSVPAAWETQYSCEMQDNCIMASSLLLATISVSVQESYLNDMVEWCVMQLL